MITSFEPVSRKSRSADPIAEAARRHFAIPYLYPIQRFVVSNVLEEKNQIVVLPIGAGKSLCYQLPARICSGITLVIVPLLALVDEQLERCREAGLMAQALRGGQSGEERNRVSSNVRSGKVDVLFTIPESLARTARKQRGRIETWYKHSREGILTATSAYEIVLNLKMHMF
jgi:superfamily II DNA helicase RecQ